MEINKDTAFLIVVKMSFRSLHNSYCKTSEKFLNASKVLIESLLRKPLAMTLIAAWLLNLLLISTFFSVTVILMTSTIFLVIVFLEGVLFFWIFYMCCVIITLLALLIISTIGFLQHVYETLYGTEPRIVNISVL
ncbi:uncharacterized protein LOC101739672 [Bombyx mori]|uniref:Uncharacterized protein n=1 Tax=Bombyx mori TaxID=7091 RepID=A0A8R2CAA7_BOMMO|nr:uncharacterized protein LOC101739672 isoform X1 [Bombyx mori]